MMLAILILFVCVYFTDQILENLPSVCDQIYSTAAEGVDPT